MAPSSSGANCSEEPREGDPVAALTEELRETSRALRDGAFSPQATIRFDSGGLGTILAGVAAFCCLAMLVMLILVVIWLNGQNAIVHQELSDLKIIINTQDAFIRQHGDRIGWLESPAQKKDSK